jgi:rhamnose utilization protein RhaD (predicted bifunctional aldolase and dehydrogenase)
LTDLDALVRRSNLLGSDPALVNPGGGNTSAKVHERGRTAMWVKASGGDLATVDANGFTALWQDELLALAERDAVDDDEMFDGFRAAQLDPAMPRASIEALMHAVVPAPHVDHIHPDAAGAIVSAVDGRRLAAECYGADAAWVPYCRSGLPLARSVAAALDEQPDAKLVLLGKHGLVTWGASSDEAYAATLDAVARAARFVPAAPPHRGVEVDERLWQPVREALGPVAVDSSQETLAFLADPEAERLSQLGPTSPHQLAHTGRRPLWVDDPATLGQRLAEVAEPPRVVLVPGLGLAATSEPARDLYLRAIRLMRGAAALGGFDPLTDDESGVVEREIVRHYR